MLVHFRFVKAVGTCCWRHLYRYFMSQSSEFCRHNPLCCFSTNVNFLSVYFVIDSVRNLLDISSYAPRDCSCSSVSCFGAHLEQILWYPSSTCVLDYTDPRLMSNLSAVSVIVISVASWTRALTRSTYPPFVKWSDGPNCPRQWRLFCHLGTSPPIGTSHCLIQFYLYCVNIVLWVPESFTPLWPRRSNDSALLSSGKLKVKVVPLL
jgi:hypothetical protein